MRARGNTNVLTGDQAGHVRSMAVAIVRRRGNNRVILGEIVEAGDARPEIRTWRNTRIDNADAYSTLDTSEPEFAQIRSCRGSTTVRGSRCAQVTCSTQIGPAQECLKEFRLQLRGRILLTKCRRGRRGGRGCGHGRLAVLRRVCLFVRGRRRQICIDRDRLCRLGTREGLQIRARDGRRYGVDRRKLAMNFRAVRF